MRVQRLLEQRAGEARVAEALAAFCAVEDPAHRFATAAEKLGLPVRLYDERHTSSEAEIRGASDIDAGAATILLEDFLAQLAR